LGFSLFHALAGGFLFVVSFPVFYYGTIGYVDPAVYPVLTGGLLAIYTGRWKSLLLLLLAGSMIKETVILLLPVAVAYLIVNRRPWIKFLAAALLAYGIPVLVVRSIFIELGQELWIPNIDTVLFNLRHRALFSLILTFGIPGLGMLIFFYNFSRFRAFVSESLYIPVITGGVCVLLLVFYSIIAAYADGRFLWPMTLFNIPFALIAFFHRSKNFNIISR
jgi:hypothetical protein